nr:hypothetical protein [Tanacetum cinerariifolium]
MGDKDELGCKVEVLEGWFEAASRKEPQGGFGGACVLGWALSEYKWRERQIELHLQFLKLALYPVSSIHDLHDGTKKKSQNTLLAPDIKHK